MFEAKPKNKYNDYSCILYKKQDFIFDYPINCYRCNLLNLHVSTLFLFCCMSHFPYCKFVDVNIFLTSGGSKKRLN